MNSTSISWYVPLLFAKLLNDFLRLGHKVPVKSYSTSCAFFLNSYQTWCYGRAFAVFALNLILDVRVSAVELIVVCTEYIVSFDFNVPAKLN